MDTLDKYQKRKQSIINDSLPRVSGELPKSIIEKASGDLPEIEGYEIYDKVGQGGMGTVYRAYEKRLRRVVAIKILDGNIATNPSIAKRFRREAILAANLSHPNIVPVYHVDPAEPPRYYTMEFVEGKSLKDKIDEKGYLDPDEAIPFIMQAGEALHHAHSHSVIHRDIKPENILLQNHVERVRITDFGIAQDKSGRLAEVTITQDATFGTPAFMSPEQNLGHPIDERSDIFSLGMTFYYMLTGRLAYEAANSQQLAVAFREQIPAPPGRFNTNVSRDLDRIVMKMIAVDRRDRYQAIKDVSTDLERISEGRKPLCPKIRHNTLIWGGIIAASILSIAILLYHFAIQANILLPLRNKDILNHADANSMHFEVISEASLPGAIPWWSSALLGDWDGDGEKDLFVTNDTTLFVATLDGEILFRKSLISSQYGSIHCSLVKDVNGDGMDEPFISHTEGMDLFSTVYNQNLYKLQEFKGKGAHSSDADNQGMLSSMAAVMCEDINGDSKQDVLMRYDTGYGLKPRGLGLYDFASGDKQWEVLIGPFVKNIIRHDITGDGVKDIIIGTGAPGNGNAGADGTNDSTAYVIAIESISGKILWATPLSKYSSEVIVSLCDFNGDGHKQIVAWTRSFAPFSTNTSGDKVVIVNTSGGIDATYDVGAYISSAICGDIDADNHDEVIVGDEKGRLHILVNHLNRNKLITIRPNKQKYYAFMIQGLLDVVGDEKPELVMTTFDISMTGTNPGFPQRMMNVTRSYNSTLWVFDNNLEEIGHFVIDQKRKNGNEIIVKSTQGINHPKQDLLVLADRVIRLRIQK